MQCRKINIAIVLVFSALLVALADSWTDPETGYTWKYRVNGDMVEINSGSYYSAAISPNPTGAVAIPSALGGKPVTSIGFYAFYNCSGLTSVTIPQCVCQQIIIRLFICVSVHHQCGHFRQCD